MPKVASPLLCDGEKSVSEKRIRLRKALQVEGAIADPLGNQWFPIKLLDISESGLGFHSRTALPDGNARMLRFTLPLNPPVDVAATVKIVYCTKHSLLEGYRVGAEFRKLDPEHRARIAELVAAG